MSNNSTPSRESAKRIGDHVKRSFLNYLDHWQEWILPMIFAGVITIASLLCCWLPHIFVLGPVTCGLYACALAALRNRPVDAKLLIRGWERLGSSVAASIFITVMSALPLLLLFGLFVAFFAAIAAVVPSPPARNQQHLNRTEIANEPATAREEKPEQLHVPMENGLGENADGTARTSQRVEEPSPTAFFLTMIGMLVFYLLFFLGIMLGWVWQLWFTTRTMFVYPLVADRGLGFVESVRRSWSETRVHFWELLLVNFAAQFISMVGMYFMYIGMLFTIPIGLTIIASVYEERFTPSSRTGEDTTPRDE